MSSFSRLRREGPVKRGLFFPFDGAAPPPYRALLVDPDPRDSEQFTSMLQSAGFIVTGARSFYEAKAVLLEKPPALLITAVRLGYGNGLELALRGKSTWPEMAVIVTSTFADRGLSAECERCGATLALKPLSTTELLAALHRAGHQLPHPDGTFEPIRSPIERRVAERRCGARQDELRSSNRRMTERRRQPWWRRPPGEIFI
jgi:DNA-binding response OmpR family regulator